MPEAKNIVLARVDGITGIGDLRRDSYQAGIEIDNTTNDPTVKLEREPPVPGHIIDPIARFEISHECLGFKREPGYMSISWQAELRWEQERHPRFEIDQ